jgi:hypothetical protein
MSAVQKGLNHVFYEFSLIDFIEISENDIRVIGAISGFSGKLINSP